MRQATGYQDFSHQKLLTGKLGSMDLFTTLRLGWSITELLTSQAFATCFLKANAGPPVKFWKWLILVGVLFRSKDHWTHNWIKLVQCSDWEACMQKKHRTSLLVWSYWRCFGGVFWVTAASDSLGYIKRLYSKVICSYLLTYLYIYTYFTWVLQWWDVGNWGWS